MGPFFVLFFLYRGRAEQEGRESGRLRGKQALNTNKGVDDDVFQNYFGGG